MVLKFMVFLGLLRYTCDFFFAPGGVLWLKPGTSQKGAFLGSNKDMHFRRCFVGDVFLPFLRAFVIFCFVFVFFVCLS